MKQKTFTVTVTANLHVNAFTEQAAVEYARTLLPSQFELIDDEVKLSSEQEQE